MPPSSRYPLGGNIPNSSKSSIALKARRGSTSKDNGISHQALDAEIEDFAPPEWRTVLNRRADLGYPDFYPSRPGYNQTEDVLTEEFVKNGFSAKTFVAVGAESFSMHGPIHNHLLNGCLGLLNKLGQEVAEKRDEGMPQIGERAFRVPVRVTYNDTKRLQFLADLANPSVPLYRLMRNPVPHGFKGVELLDTMFAPALAPGTSGPQRVPSGSVAPPKHPEPIPLDRATWFIRVLGSNEISAHRGRAQPTLASSTVTAPSPAAAATPSSTTTTFAAPVLVVSSNDWYTQEFTNMFNSWLRNQLGQLSLPARGPHTSGVPPPKAGTGVLGDEKARSRWVAKWDYSTKFLRELHTRYMISSRILCSWLVDTLAIANLAQLGFVGQLIGDYLSDVARHTSIGRICVRVACEKLKEVRQSPALASLGKIEEMLQFIITALFNANPEVLLSPATWRLHAAILEQIILPVPDKAVPKQTSPETKIGLLQHPNKRRTLLNTMRGRSDALVFVPAATESTTSPRRQQMEDLHKLDGMNGSTDMTHLCRTYFDGASSPLSPTLDAARLEEKTFVLLNWSMGLFQLGLHRGYAVHTLLIIWEKLFNRARSKLPGFSGNFDFFPILYKWLDTCEMAKKEENAFAIGITFGELTRQGLFSYGRYIKALISNGHSERSRPTGKPPSHHLPLLAAMPIFVEANDLLQQRRLALCGDDPELGKRLDEWEERLMENFKEEVREYVPEVFGWKRFGRSANFKELVNHQMPSTKALSRYLFLQARFWLAPAAAERLKQNGRRPAMNASTFVRVVHIFHLCNGYSTIADFLIKGLRNSEDEEILCIIIDTIRRAADIWTAMDRWPPIIDALLDRNQAQDKRGRHHAGLAALLLGLSGDNRLSEDEEYEVRASIKKHNKGQIENSFGWVDASESMEHVQQSISTGNTAVSSQLASKLFSRHGPFSSWSAIWWKNVIQAMQTSETDRSSVVNAALAHVEEVDDSTNGSLDQVVDQWLEELSQANITELLGSKSSPTFCAIVLNLTAHRKLRIVPKLLDKLVYPVWKTAATNTIVTKGRISGRSVRVIESTVTLAQHLLLDCPPNKALPPINLREALVLQTERGRTFNAVHVPVLIRHLPFLVILETNRTTPDRLRTQISTLVHGLAMTPHFKAAAFRQLNVLKDSFLSNEWSKPSLESTLEAGMVDTLKLIMSQGSSGTSKNLHSIASLKSSSRFSAWRYTSIVLGMRVEFKRLAMRIENGDDTMEAKQTLNQLVHATLDRDATADDTDLLCEAFRGIEAAAAQEIVAVGLERLSALVSQVIGAESQSSLETAGKSIDLMLRVLDSASSAPSSSPSEHSVLSARHTLIDLLSVSLQSIERQLTNEDEHPLIEGVTSPQPGDLLAIILKLLKFILGLPITENASLATPRPDFGRLASSFLRVITALSSSASVETIKVMTDMLVYIVDSASWQSRPSVFTSLMAEATTPAVSEALTQNSYILSALPAISPSRRPMALIRPATVEEGTDSTHPLDDRPWELFEQLNPAPKVLPHGEQFLSAKPIRDTASIPMSLFGPQVKRDALADVPDLSTRRESDSESDPWDRYEDYASERTLGDGFAGEPTALKQLTTSLFAGPEAATVEDDITINTNGSPLLATSPANSISASSTTARPRRHSTRLAGGSGQTTRDAIRLEDDDDDDDDDDDSDDIDVVEVPAGKRPRVGSKSVAGKTTRKTTGGKTVSRKAFGGKAPRGVSGKAPRGGRRRSIAD